MDYDHEGIGTALKRLRQATGMPQNQLAAKIRRSGANVSRLERPGSNPKMSTLLRYLAAIDADLGDLARELREHGDSPKEAFTAGGEQRLRENPSSRQLARSMLVSFGASEAPPALCALVHLVDRQGETLTWHQEQIDDCKRRLRQLEIESPAGEEAPEDAG